jgi:23S rRNA pseudouridine2604 synthase
MKEIIYPLRINKYLAYKGYGTRREMDALISKGKVLIDGKKAKLGDKVHENNVVKVLQKEKSYIYLAYNKPKGIVTHSPTENESGIEESVGRSDVFPIGRLDKDSEGLLILTNDGRLSEKLLTPESNHEKEYVVGVDKEIRQNAISKLQSGVNIEGYITKEAKAKKLSEKKLAITLTEGKKHQIRRMLAALGYTTLSLKRIRILNVRLEKLKQNETRRIEGDELNIFLKRVGLK